MKLCNPWCIKNRSSFYIKNTHTQDGNLHLVVFRNNISKYIVLEWRDNLFPIAAWKDINYQFIAKVCEFCQKGLFSNVQESLSNKYFPKKDRLCPLVHSRFQPACCNFISFYYMDYRSPARNCISINSVQ